MLNARDITVRKALEADLRFQALHDTLTGLANRTMFTQQTASALRTSDRIESVGALFIDLDDFKTVNDSLGHGTGDELLCRVAERLGTTLRPHDTLARLGGDEFAILLPRSNKRNGVRRAEELDRKLNNAYAAWNDQQIPIKASCGVHMYAANAEMRELLQAADEAMYKIKQERRAKLGITGR